jgi:hypothetical protein
VRRDVLKVRWREANGGAQCGKPARCVRRGGDWKRGAVERPAGAPALDPTDVEGTGNVVRSSGLPERQSSERGWETGRWP